MLLCPVVLLLAVVAGGKGSAPAGEVPPGIQIDSDYPGGNIVVERIEKDRVLLRPDLRDTKGWWFYWNFRVRGAQGRTLTFQFKERKPIGVRGPAVSTDGGRSWKWLGRRSVQGASFRFSFPEQAGEVRFAFAIPYLETDLQRFLARHRGNRHLVVHPLCQSRKGRTIRRLHLGCVDREPKYRIVLVARHHACESVVSFALEGFLAAVLGQDELGRWFQQNVEVLAVPFMDKDGVEQGDQGKNRRPYDHNRDYGNPSRYPSVAALKRLVPRWSQGKLRAWIDWHCPGIGETAIYQVGVPDPDRWREQQRFGGILQRVRRGPLVYRAQDDLPFGKGWNGPANYRGRMSSTMWACTLPEAKLVTLIEFPYAEVLGRPVTPETARLFGRDVARAVRHYLQPESP